MAGLAFTQEELPKKFLQLDHGKISRPISTSLEEDFEVMSQLFIQVADLFIRIRDGLDDKDSSSVGVQH